MGGAASAARHQHQPQARAQADLGGGAACADAAGAPPPKRLHEGIITVAVPDTLWATDATEAWTRQEGRCAVFVIVDHASNEVCSDAAKRTDRIAAADPPREVCSERFGSVEQAVASGLAPTTTAAPASEVDHLGIARSPAFHSEPETNGVAEKAVQTLTEQPRSGSSASTRSTSCAPPSAPSAAPTTNTG